MSKSYCLCITLALMLCVQARFAPAADDFGDFVLQIKQILEEESGAYERFLSRSATLLEKRCKKRRWSDLRKALQAGGWEPTAVRERRNWALYRCTVVTNVLRAADGPKMAGYLEFGVWTSEDKTKQEERTVWGTSARLIMSPTALCEKVIREKRFPAETVIGEAMAAWPVTRTAKEFPVLQKIDLSFGRVATATVGSGTPGFTLGLVFHAKDDEERARHVECWSLMSSGDKGSRTPITNWRYRDSFPTNLIHGLAKGLRAAAGRRDVSYQRVVRDATHTAQRVTLGRNWSTVEKALDEQGLRLLDNRPDEYGCLYDYLAVENACKASGGTEMDLVLQFWTTYKKSRIAPTVETVARANAALTCAVRRPYAEAMGKGAFGKGTVIQLALACEETKTAAKEHPFVNSIEVSYEVLGNRWAMWNPWGFRIWIELIKGRDDDSSGQRIWACFASGLDPMDAGGWAPMVKTFVPSNTVTKAECHTGGGWRQSEDHFWLQKKGAPSDRRGSEEPESTDIASLGDLRALSRTTTAIYIATKDIYDNDLKVLSEFPDLFVLHMSTCDDITDHGLSHLNGLRKLKYLRLSGEKVRGSGLQHLRDLSKLESLHIYSTSRLSDRGVAEIAKMKQLRDLWLGGMTDKQLGKISVLTELRELSFGGHVTDEGIAQVSRLEKLESLRLQHIAGVTSRGLRPLSKLRNLTTISLISAPLGDDGLERLADIESLKYVAMHGLNITDEGLMHLSKLQGFTRLYVTGCEDVTERGIEALRASLKGEFVREHP